MYPQTGRFLRAGDTHTGITLPWLSTRFERLLRNGNGCSRVELDLAAFLH